MFTENSMDIRKNILIAVSLVIISIASSIYIARDYQKGLQMVFWFCMFAGMGAYLLKNMVNRDNIFYLFLFTITVMHILPYSFKYLLPLGSCFLIFLVMLFYNNKIMIKNILHTRNGRVLILYVILNLVLLPFSINKKTSATYLLSFPAIILLWDWMIQHFDSEDRVVSVLKVFNLIGFFYSLLGIAILGLKYFGVSLGGYLDYLQLNRLFYYVSSVFPNANTHGMLLAFTIPCGFYLFLESRDKRFYTLSLLAMGFNLFMTFSRSSWGAAALAMAIILLYKYRKAKYIGMVAAILLVASLPLVLNIEISVGKFSDGLFTLSSRGLLWQAAVKAIADRPITGFGVGNSVGALDMYSIYVLGRTPHNTFLRMWVEMGVFGLLIYLAFIYNIMRAFHKTNKKTMLLVTVYAAIAGSLFQQIFETMLLAGLSIMGGYFFVFSALFESLTKKQGGLGDEYDESMLPG